VLVFANGSGASCVMAATKSVRRPAASKAPTKARATRATAVKPVTRPRAVRPVFTPLAAGQIWRLGEANLKVEMVGKLLLHYKLAKPNAVRTPTSIAGITTLVKYMKKNKAVLISG
jgi:hypothetical protein